MTRPTATQLNDAERTQLIEQHTDYVRSLALVVRRDTGSNSLELDELTAYGLKGLVEAANRFDPTRGASFKTFSYYRIRGAMYDGLRQTGWLSRDQYARFQAASNELLQNVNDRPAPVGPQDSLEDTVGRVTEALDQLAVVFITSLDDMGADRAVADRQTPDASRQVEDRQVQSRIRQAVEQLPERERQLVQMHYFQDYTLEAAGAQLGMSKSWASRLHARAIKALTELLDPTLASG